MTVITVTIVIILINFITVLTFINNATVHFKTHSKGISDYSDHSDTRTFGDSFEFCSDTQILSGSARMLGFGYSVFDLYSGIFPLDNRILGKGKLSDIFGY